MRFLKYFGLLICVLSVMAMASDNKLGIREVRRVTFHTTVHIGSNVLQPGEYVVRHAMDGEDHMMTFERVNAKGKEVVKVKCTLVPLSQKADQDQSVFQTTASNERVLQELVFAGDTAKHVF
jgi:hypothetical protein